MITENKIRPDHHVWFAAHRWRYRWLFESLHVQAGLKAAGRRSAVLSDIRLDVDTVIEQAPCQRIDIINRSGSPFAGGDGSSLDLVRGAAAVTVSAADIAAIPSAITSRPEDLWLLVTNLSRDDLQAPDPRCPMAKAYSAFIPG